ncbi:MAG: hypothetical protein CVU15_11970 [Betaproteobacteria bacterium HGW-Betaproteobacteria-1]|nr:MAG: hypothetical protein CVU15_11970 [Betaproteobacteria bacterium HGW-Betaproteobacteria-1]
MKGLEREHSSASCFRQQGAALIVIMFIVGLAAVALLINSYNADSLRVQQEEKTMQTLGQAKEALLAWSVSYRDLPGMMPYPNRGSDAAGYADGGADCFFAVPFNYQFLIGMLPSRDTNDINCMAATRKGLPDFRDAAGNPLWYAVSRNLVRNYEAPAINPVINPGMVNVDAVKPKPYDGTDASSSYPWLIVRDINGNVLSDRVAAVIISPGPPLPGQNRTNTATSAHFLDQITIGAMTYSNRDYDQPDEDFVMGGDATLSNTFNDRLVFITIDELIYAVEKRAANEIREALLNYVEPASASRPNGRDVGYFPYAAPLGAAKNYGCREPAAPPHDLTRESSGGLLPISPADSGCTYTQELVGFFPIELKVTTSCDLGFDQIASVEFTKSGAAFTSNSGSCTHSGTTCTCTGAGSCNEGGDIFTCDASGSCETDMSIFVVNASSVRFNGEFTTSSLRCSLSNACGTVFSRELVCSGFGPGSGGLGCSDPTFNTGTSALPTWIISNRWYEYFYYRTSRGEAGNLTTGTRDDVTAMLIGTGGSLLAPAVAVSKGADQVRPSCEVNDYMDSIENADEDLVFDAHYLRRNTNYNDRVYIVAP